MIMATHADEQTLAFAQRADLGTLSQQGPVTPDHIIRTKRLPMLGTDVDAYARGYRDYFDEQARHAKDPKTMLDPAPRMALDPGFGLAAAGRTAKDAARRRLVSAQHASDAARAGLGRLSTLPASAVRDRILGWSRRS
jgi:rhamnose utilization protein RhaD (predicted bifunctional aldolase and dehydrogenase)